MRARVGVEGAEPSILSLSAVVRRRLGGRSSRKLLSTSSSSLRIANGGVITIVIEEYRERLGNGLDVVERVGE